MIDHDALAARVRQDREDGTPGPWEQAKDDQGGINYTDPCSGTCWNVAYAHYHCGYPIDGRSSNARRIAALPDLEAAYLDLYDEVTRLRAERDRFEAALGRACQVGGTTYLVERAEKAEAERDALRAALVDHNDLLRSASQIAKREGIDGERATTNWDAYYNRVAVVLKRHHAISNEARQALKGQDR